MNQLFSPELIPDYMHAHPEYGVKRILTYTVYRFLSFAGKEDDTLAAYIKETLFPMEDALDFSLISDYLALDPYFCPVPEEGSFDAFFLYTAISILENAFDEFALGDELAIIDDLILTKYPILGSVALDDADIRLDALIGSGAEFYAVLYLALTRYPSALGSLLPQFGTATMTVTSSPATTQHFTISWMNILKRKTVCCSHFSWNFPTRLLTQHSVITRLTLKHCSQPKFRDF